MTSSDKKLSIIQDCELEINKILENWNLAHSSGYDGGKMRELRGSSIETFVMNTINNIGKLYNVDFIAICGDNDKKDLVINLPDGKQLHKNHQVDIHIYKNKQFIAVIECKAYLDSCYYERACSDFAYFKKFGYNIRKIIFTFENSISYETKTFIDHMNERVCDDVFCIFDGKRTSGKPIYDIKHKKKINITKLTEYIDAMISLCLDS